MTAALPDRHDAAQLLRLRTLRVERAREAVAAAQRELDAAAIALRAQQARVERLRGEIDALEHALVHGLAPQLPRWSTLVVAQREALADRLERAEYALVEDEHTLEQAQEKLQQAKAEWTRAQAREDAVRGLAEDAKRAHRLGREQLVEREVEDQGFRRAAT